MDRGEARALAQQAAGLYRAKRYADALPILQRLHAFSPSAPNLTYRLARCLQALDRIEEATNLAQALVDADDERGHRLLAKLATEAHPTETTIDIADDFEEAREHIELLADEPDENPVAQWKKRGVRKRFRKLLESSPEMIPDLLDEAYLTDRHGPAMAEIVGFLREHEDLWPHLDDVGRKSREAYVWRAIGWRTLRVKGDTKPERRGRNVTMRRIGLDCPHQEIRNRIAHDIGADAPAVLDANLREYVLGFHAALLRGGGREVVLALSQHAFGDFTQSKIPRIRAVLGMDHHTEIEAKFLAFDKNDILEDTNPELLGFKGIFCDAAQYMLWKAARGDYGENVRKQLVILQTSTGDSPDDAEDIYARLMRK